MHYGGCVPGWYFIKAEKTSWELAAAPFLGYGTGTCHRRDGYLCTLLARHQQGFGRLPQNCRLDTITKEKITRKINLKKNV
jgi:hypothetical protein